jgi:hypothetical protein
LPVPPTFTLKTPPEMFDAFKFVKPAPEPLNKLAVTEPLNVVAIALLYV